MRTIQDVQKDYGQKCTKAGDLAYRIRCFEEELSSLQDEMLKLNQEAQAIEAAAAKPAEEVQGE